MTVSLEYMDATETPPTNIQVSWIDSVSQPI